MGTLELKVPPLAVVVLFAAAMWVTSLVVPSLALHVPFKHALAVVLALVGISAVLLGALSFRRAHTTLNPLAPETASSLVTAGIYRVTRNPMYLGFALVLLAWAVLLANTLALFFVPAFIIYMNRFQIEPEER